MNCPHCHSSLADDARFCGACGKATSPTEAQSAEFPFADAYAAMVGKEIAGRYRIGTKLGEGGMGAVFRAEQLSLKRTCAVKLLRPGLAGNAQMLRRFNAEAEAIAKLSHPNTVDIYDFGQDTDGTLFIAMEFVEGLSLRDLIQQEAPLSIGRSLAIAAQIAASLTDAHAHAVIHRDLKPDNVMLSKRGKQKDIVHVLDFGIAKLRDANRQGAAMTQAGDMLGTPQYMAPEQISGEEIDGRADVYALGCILYEMITGRLAFEASSILAMLTKHLAADIDAPSQRRPDLRIPPEIDQLILSALAKDASARPATMELYGEQLAAIYQTLPIEQRAASSTGLPMSAIIPITPTPAPTPMPAALAATAAAGPPPALAPPAVMPPVGAPPPPSPYGNFVPPTTMPDQHVKPQPAKPDRQMLYMVIVILVFLGGIGVYFLSVRNEKMFDIKPPPIPGQTQEQRDERDQQLKDEIEKAVKDLDKNP